MKFDAERKLMGLEAKLDTISDQETRETVEKESEKIAREKLAQIMDDGFTEFGIRFVNIGEYEKIIAEKSFGGEAYAPRKSRTQPISFKEYLEKGSWGQGANWSRMAVMQSEWDHNVHNMEAMRTLISLLRKVRSDLKGGEDSKRKEVVKNFREELQKKIEDVWLGEDQIEKILLAGRDANRTGIERYGKDRIEVIQRFFEDDGFLDDKDNLRQLILAIAYTPIDGMDAIGQYHLALLYGSKAFKKTEFGEVHSWNPNWRYIKNKGIEEEFLGAIANMSNKELIEELVSLSKQSGNLAHPIFDQTGKVRWPREFAAKEQNQL